MNADLKARIKAAEADLYFAEKASNRAQVALDQAEEAQTDAENKLEALQAELESAQEATK